MKVKQSIAIIGCGNMGSAIIKGLAKSELFAQIYAYDPALKGVAPVPGVVVANSLAEAISSADLVLLAVKPYLLFELISEIDQLLSSRKPTIISIAAGVKLSQIKEKFSSELSLVRVMPNISCTVGAGVSAVFSTSKAASEVAQLIFSTVGEVIVASREDEIDIFTALSAGGPAFLCEVIEGLARGGEKMGLTREQSLKAAVATTAGTAKLISESGEDPLVWRNRVATAGGTTERGLAVLNSANTVELFAQAVEASTKRARENLSKK